MHELHVGPFTHERLWREVKEMAVSLAQAGVRNLSVTFAFGADPELPLFGVPVPVATDRLPEYIRGLEADGMCRLGRSNITIERAGRDGVSAGVEVFSANDDDIYFFGEEGPLLAEVRDRWARIRNDAIGRV